MAFVVAQLRQVAAEHFLMTYTVVLPPLSCYTQLTLTPISASKEDFSTVFANFPISSSVFSF